MDSKLSLDTNIEIFSRTALKTLDTLRCTSKELNTLTHSPYFLDLYNHRNNVVSGFLVQDYIRSVFYNKFAPSLGSNILDLGFLPRKTQILATSEQGLIVFESPNAKQHRLVSYYICKPTTKQVLAIPNPKTRFLTTKVSIIVLGSKPLRYKIVRLSEPKYRVLQRRDKYYTTYRCEIFDSTTWKWKLLDLLLLPFCVFPANPQPITTCGSIYVLLTNDEILKFDAFTEKWTTFSSPTPTLDYPFYTAKELIKYKGRLGFACRPDDQQFWEIWVMNVDELWEKVLVFNEEEDIRRASLIAMHDTDTSVMLDHNILIFYRFKGGSKVNKVTLSDKPYKMFVLRSDLGSITLTGR